MSAAAQRHRGEFWFTGKTFAKIETNGLRSDSNSLSYRYFFCVIELQ